MPDLSPKLSVPKSSQAVTHTIPQPAPVTASNLQKLSTNPESTDRIKLFIADQTRYAKAHAAEGRAKLASRKSDGTPCTPPRSAPLVSAFDTPILKPRVPGSDIDVRVTKPRVSGSTLPASQALGKAVNVRASKGRKENITEKKREESAVKVKEVDVEREDRREEAKRPTTRKPKVIPVAASKKRPKTPTSSELDHVARLADRRERKRARRDIIKPAPISSSSADKENDAMDDDMNDDDDASLGLKLKKPTKGGNSKPSKKKRVLPGMALVYGFSAPNVGMNRLTIKPSASPQYGVFNRGRASSKAKVGTKPIPTRGALFSEDRFLSSTRSRPAGPSLRSGRFRHLTDEELSSHSSSVASVPAAPVRNKLITVRGNKMCRPLSPEVANEGEGDPVTRDGSIAVESVPWDIEDGRSLFSKSTSAQSVKQSTTVLDIRQHRLGRLLEKSRPPPKAMAAPLVDSDPRDGDQASDVETRREPTPASAPDLPSQDRIPSRRLTCGTMSSLSPSESASQVLRRAQIFLTGIQPSKHFTQPRKLSAKENRPVGVTPPVKPPPASQSKPLSSPPQAALVLPSPSPPSHSLHQPLPVIAAQEMPEPSSPDVKRPSSADSLERVLKALDVPDPSLRLHSRRSRPSMRRPDTAPDAEPYPGDEVNRDPEARDLPPDVMIKVASGVDTFHSEGGTPYVVDGYGRVYVLQGYAEDIFDAQGAHEDECGHEDRSLSEFDDLIAGEGAMIYPDEYSDTGSHRYAGCMNSIEDDPDWIAVEEPMDEEYAVNAYDDDDLLYGHTAVQDDFAARDGLVDDWSEEEVRVASQAPGPSGLFLRTAYHAEEDVARQLQGHWRPQTY